MIAYYPAKDLEVKESNDSSLRPRRLRLELAERQGLGVKKGRCWTARDVVAEEGGQINKDWKAEGHTRSTDPIAGQFEPIAQMATTYGPPNSYPCFSGTGAGTSFLLTERDIW